MELLKIRIYNINRYVFNDFFRTFNDILCVVAVFEGIRKS